MVIERPVDVRVGVIFLGTSSQRGNALLKFLATGIDGIQGLEIGAGWEELDGGELRYQLGRFTHIVMLLDGRTGKSRWLPFIYGYCSGAERDLYFFSDKPTDMPGYFSPVRRFVSEHALLNHLIEDIEEYNTYRAIDEAREELIGRGFGLNDDALIEACRSNQQDVVELYLAIGFPVDTVDSRGVSMLNHAVRSELVEMVTMLLESGADPNIVSEDRGNTPLMDAAAQGSERMAGLLLAAGADTDIQSKSGQTALMMAVGDNHVEAARAILKAGADLSLTDQLGMTAEKYARLFNREEMISLFPAS
jgi:hypothetical protein